MAQRKLPINYCRRALMLGLLSTALAACAHAQGEQPIGMSLLFLNKGKEYLVVQRFDPDGQRGPVPGALGASSTDGKQMSFMPGDSTRGVPQFVEVEWEESTPAAEAALNRLPNLTGKVSKGELVKRQELLAAAYALRNHYTCRIDLTPILTPALLEQVRTNRSTTNLKLTVLFKDDEVTLIAEPEVWRSGQYSASDNSPAAAAARRAIFEETQEKAQRIFFSMGYYVGRISGALTGALTLSVRLDGTLNAVINAGNGQVFTLTGDFDTHSTDAIRRLTLKGTGPQGSNALSLSGSFDLKARKAHGAWSLSSPAQKTPNLTGQFMAIR